MKKLSVLSLCLGCLTAVSTSHAIDLKQSKVTQVVNDVQIISAADQAKKTAAVNDNFNMPDILRTGAASRAELVAPDETVTRVGANTIFSFDPANRTIDLKQGSLLFHSPHGKGGGTIHTGSATASVLGTTLIITTTPTGGFKVLSLEGDVEVKFLNGLKQSLAPGQMSFVLPGGNQLSPIIVFRLDSLTQNSQLVKGFNQQLASLPLIQQQIDKQLKLIQSGKFSDTGLGVGDDASASQVQVLDLNTLQRALDHAEVNKLTGVEAALAADATINQPSLSDASIPIPPDRIFLDEPFILEDNNFFVGQPFNGFAAKNIFINNAGGPLLTVDMAPFGNLEEFDVVAKNNINIHGSVTFAGFSPVNSLFFLLVAGNQIIVSPNAVITANLANFELTAAGAFTLGGAQLLNNSGNMVLAFGSDIVVNNHSHLHALGSLSFTTAGNLAFDNSSASANTFFFGPVKGSLGIDSSTLIGNTFAIFSAEHDISVKNSFISVGAYNGIMSFTSASGSIKLHNNSFQTHILTLNSGDGILLDSAGNFTTGGNAVANFNAKNLITVNNTDLTPFATVNMDANTINLLNVSFADGSIDNFGTHTGQVSVNAEVNTPGQLNLHNVSYGETAITSASQINLSSGPGSTPGIYSYANGH
jgi:hypothetical protein